MKKLIGLIILLFICNLSYAGTYTTNYSLYKPAVNETDWSAKKNSDYDIIDRTLYALSRDKEINVTVIEPDQIDVAGKSSTGFVPIWHNASTKNFTVTEWKAWSDDDNVTMNILILDDPTDYSSTVILDAVEIATDGTSVYYASDTTMTHAVVSADDSIALSFDTDDTPDYVQLYIKGLYD